MNIADQIQKILENKNLTLIDEYKNYRTKLNIKCNKCEGTFSRLVATILKNKQKEICPYCRHGHNPTQLKYIQSLSFETTPVYGIIYRITGPTGKVYIGQTMQKFKKRYHSHKQKYNNPDSSSYDMNISRAFRKYGFNNFKWKILHFNVPWDKLDELEIQEIKNYDSYHNGYNSTLGGKGKTFNAIIANKQYKKRLLLEEEKIKRKEIEQQKKDLISFSKHAKNSIKSYFKNKESDKHKSLQEHINRSIGGRRKYTNKIPDSSAYRGVCWHAHKNGCGKWKASIKHKGKKIHIGLFDDEIEAAKAYDEKALLFHGIKAKLNFP
jgi:group I intron endonuclease